MLVMAARYGREDEPVTRNRRFLLGAVAWVVVVTAGATLVWTVISDAGAEVSGELPTTTVVSTTGGEQPPDRPTATGPAAPSTPAPGQPAGLERRAWQGAAGRVVAECQGGAIALVGAQPTSGWTVELDHTGPDDLRVEFEHADDAGVRVEATCVNGAPSFVVESKD
jgi:hypothetical protein